ncbi:MAG TPA: ABC transporter permease [Candidatus Acidoferrales bacterium]|nr:ABC transporter permease [Candidatus Acidoferrales bacterium]
MRGANWIDQFRQDFRYSMRTLFKDRRFALLAIFALALGIGASTVVFSVIYDGLLNPFPYRDANGISIFQIHDVSRRGNGGRGVFSFNEFLDYREQNHVFSDMVGTSNINVLYESAAGAQEFGGAFVTTNTFPFLGVKPLLGRWLGDDDGKPGAPPVFVMSYRCWQEQFGGDPKLVGTLFTLNGVSRTLVGIMPDRFRYFGVSVYFPLGLYRGAADSVNEYGRPRYLVAEERRKPGVTLQTVAADIDVIARRLAAVYPKDYPKRFTIWTDSLASDVVGDSKQMLYVLLAAVGALLLIACSNVANLLLARATVREKEIALRASLGASQGRLVRQLLVESFVLAAAGGALGCLMAYGGIQLVAATIPPILPGEAALELNRAVLLFAFGITVLTIIVCGLAPAIHAMRGSLSVHLSSSGKGASGGFRHGKLRAALVIVEVALSIVLLAGAGLMMRTLYALTNVSLGFDPSNVLAASVTLPPATYTTVAQKKAFFQQALARIAALPGVVSAAETISLPPYNAGHSEVTVPGTTHTEAWDTLFDVCSEEYFKTLHIPLLRGRLLSEDDVDSARFVAVVNQTFARNYLGDDPIGRKFKFNVFDTIAQTPHNAYFEVVGIVSDVKNQGLQDAPMPQAYIPYTITAYANRAILVKTAVAPLSLLKSLREQIWAVDRNVAIGSAGTLDSYLDRFSYAEPRFSLVSIGAFASIGLLLAAIGVFSVMAYAVSLQTHDIGVRMALGAQPSDILRMVLGKGLVLVAAGSVTGVATGLAVARLLSSQLWGVSANDPLTFFIVVLVVVAVGAAASLMPARRATRVDPLIALREE